MIQLILILSAVVIALLGGLFFSIKGNIKQSKDIERLNDIIEECKNIQTKATYAEIKKNKIREKYDAKENDINNGNYNSGILPDDVAHNHDRNRTCSEDCPAYTE